MQVYQALALARERLAAAGIEEGEAQMMARLLLAAHCGVALRDLPLQLRQETDPAPLLPQLEQLAQGEPIQYLLGRVVVADTIDHALALARKYYMTMPIIEQVNQVLFEGKKASDAVRELMLRDPREEDSGLTW